jgi:hypothetical protein
MVVGIIISHRILVMGLDITNGMGVVHHVNPKGYFASLHMARGVGGQT